MAWDFSTDPQYGEKLTLARGFADEEIIPLETLSLDQSQLVRAVGPLPVIMM